MEEMISEGLTIRSEDIAEGASVTDVEEIIGDGCFLHMHFVSDQQIDMVLADSANMNQYSFSIKPKFDERKCKIFLSCDGSIDKSCDLLTRQIGMDVIEENKSLKKRLEYLEKSMRSMEIELRLERANKILKINELLDRISLLEKYRAVKD
jgi:hypothetical protein